MTSRWHRLLPLLVLLPVCAFARADAVSFDIPAQPLPGALRAFADQAKMQLLYRSDAVQSATANAVVGSFDPRAALELLLKDTGLEVIYSKDDAATIRPRAPGHAPARTSEVSSPESFRLAQAAPDSATSEATRSASEATRDPNAAPEPAAPVHGPSLEEIVITGSHIRGVKNSASPLLVFDRQAIEKTGYTTTHQFIESLPQNFRGGLSEAGGGPAGGISQIGAGTGNNIEGTNLNFSNGVNLYGLGSRATLVLLNGQRMAPTNGGSSPDISVIPLTAIERIEVLTDGASALYGSDAVGGVINLILRTDYAGNQTRARYGTVTEGDSAERQVSQAFGRNWTGGGVLLNYEYYRRDSLDASNRPFTRELPSPTYLLPETDMHSVMATARTEVTPRVELFGTGLYSSRRSDSATSNDVGGSLWINEHHGEAEQYNLTAGGRVDVGGTWRADVTAAYGFNDTSRRQVQIRTGMGTAVFDNRERSDVKSFDAKADGRVFDLRGRSVRAALGAHYREEGFDNGGVDENRSSVAVFGEMLLPLSARLELSLAARHEEYSDFGSTTDPKVGLSWALPEHGLNLRTTYGTSFRAPLLAELNGSVQGVLFDVPRPSGGTTLTAFAIGSNPGLQPETAETFTLGFDLRPALAKGLNVAMTYFDIRFVDRIEAAGAFFDAFSDPQYADIIIENPDPDFLVFLSQQPDSFNATPSQWTDAEVLVDNRFLNTAALKISGLDLGLSYDLPVAGAHWNLSLSGTYLFKKDVQLSASVPPRDVLDTVDNPVDLKLRGGVSFNRGPLSANAFLNYTDGYRDARFTPAPPVASWTTVDVNFGYRFAAANRWVRGAELSLNVQNLLDEDPPYVDDLDISRNGGVHFDVANASALGRFIVLQASLDW